MQKRVGIFCVILSFIISGCGGDSSSNPTVPGPTIIVTPTPSPTPTVTPTPVPAGRVSIDRLKGAFAQGEERTVSPVTIAFAVTETSAYTAGSTISTRDPRIRLLGGLHLYGPSYPRSDFPLPQAVNVHLPLVPHDMFSPVRYGLVTGLEFLLPFEAREFELQVLDTGAPGPIELAIDGHLINDSGFNVGWRSDGSIRYMRFGLPLASRPRLITLYTNGNPIGLVNLPGNGSLLALPTSSSSPASIVFEGDSIAEGSGATLPTRTWPLQAAFLMGVRNPVLVAVGSSGYLAHRTGNAAIPQRIENVTKAVGGQPPDAVVIAAGINDCSVAPPTPYSMPEVNAAALSYFRALRAAAPDMLIFVVGPFTDYNNANYSDTSYACRDAMFQAASQVSLTYMIDVSDWVTLANRNSVFDGNMNGPHPIDGGHAIYGLRAALAIKSIVAGL